VADAGRAGETHALPPASISAQLRHLRKPEYGGYAVEKRPREVSKVLRGEDFGTVWEYQLRRTVRRKVAGAHVCWAGRSYSRKSRQQTVQG